MSGLVIVLDRVIEDFVPSYSVYGMTACDRCVHLVYVGHESARAITEEDARPLCLECAHELYAAAPEDFLHVPRKNVGDGPCPRCGEIHPP